MKQNRRTGLDTKHGMGLGLAIIGVVACAIAADVVHVAAAQTYVLSGSVDGTVPFHVDDALDVHLNGNLLHSDGIPAPGSPDVRAPITFTANVGDILRFQVRDTYGICTRLTRLILTDAVGRFAIADPGFDFGCGRPPGDQGIPHTFEFAIPVLADLPAFEDRLLPGRAWAGPVQGPDGLLYGVTYNGGNSNLGTIYSFDPVVSTVRELHSFDGTLDGSAPYEELALDPATGRFYGSTYNGGPGNAGTIFEFDPSTNAVVTLATAANFAGHYHPKSSLVKSGGFLFGTLGYPNGAVFRMAPDGSGFTIIHPFSDVGALPQDVTLGADGLLYGVTAYGGGYLCVPPTGYPGCGTVFRLKPVLPGDPDEQFQTLYQFHSPTDSARSNFPQGGVVYGSDGLLYGTTYYYIFRLDPQAPDPAATFQFVWTQGRGTSLSVVEGADRRLYGADYTGTNNQGRIFSVEKDGTDAIVLYDFSNTTGSTSNGPFGRLFRNAVGTVFGTTEWTNASPPFPGTIFAISGTGVNPPSTPVLSNVAITPSINENDLATLSGQISDADATSTFTLVINWGEGAPQTLNYPAGTTSFSQTHRYLDDDPTLTSSDAYTVNLTLTNNHGGTATGSTSVTVNNVAPGGLTTGFTPSPIVVGATTTLNGTLVDVGTKDTHRVVITWGDGTPDTPVNLPAGVLSFSVTHQFTVSGTLPFSAVWSDDDLGSNVANSDVIVDPPPPPPVLSVNMSRLTWENDSALMLGQMSAAPGSTLTLTINWGDGSSQTINYPTGTSSFTLTHRYLDDDPSGTSFDNYTVTVTLTDIYGGSATVTLLPFVGNVAPVLNSISVSPSVITEGGSTTLTGTLSDVGTLDSHTVVIEWNDGTPATTIPLPVGVFTFSATHQFTFSIVFNLNVTVRDDDGDQATGTTSITVNPPPPAAPSNLTAVAVSNSAITVSWLDNSSNESGFELEHCSSKGRCILFALLATLPPNVTSVTVSGLVPGSNHVFRVRAVNAGGKSAYSNTANARTPKK